MKPQDPPARQRFAETILNNIAQDNHYLENICFSDEVTIHVSGVVKRHNVSIWCTDNQHVNKHLEITSKATKVSPLKQWDTY